MKICRLMIVTILQFISLPFFAMQQEPTPPLHYAAEKGDLPSIQELIKKGNDINSKDRFGDPHCILQF